MGCIETVTCCTGLFIPRLSSVSAEQSQSGVEQILESQIKAVLAKTSPEIQIKLEDLKSLVDIPKLPHASGNRMLQNLKDFNSMPLKSKIEYLRTTAKFYHPVEKGKSWYYDYSWRWRMEKTHVKMLRTHSAQKPGGFKAIRIDWWKQRNWSSLKNWDYYSYWCSWYWSAGTITEYSRTLHMDFDKSLSRKICERNSSSQV